MNGFIGSKRRMSILIVLPKIRNVIMLIDAGLSINLKYCPLQRVAAKCMLRFLIRNARDHRVQASGGMEDALENDPNY